MKKKEKSGTTRVETRGRKVSATLKVDVDTPSIAEKTETGAHLTNREIQLIDWARYSAIASVFDMYTCTKLETESQRNRPAVLSKRHPNPTTTTSQQTRGSRRGSPLPSSSHDRRRRVREQYLFQACLRNRSRSSTTPRGSKSVTPSLRHHQPQ